ncbi:DUF6069 family protein [Amycolatopsis acidiphila]|uniref:Uncharacterized protein n=1 Tax=Amycolatopsis acidiphila TaxID=715473 RepID=A0A557ZYI7_9PSEU|nr:DUF6069 family protein [Amycolatopsis acidiphila]TVT17076.1 hypothetical protein FNH06_32680 [Amycolatopsis acidiphila]UIJ61982.1 DUF6069 family protein [Amycolatopsis acidiphila]GHG56777.1 hypothetical protein GCM10017788_07870 [Amycolatopsis acidiphila]
MSDYSQQVRLDPARLWAGGVATALVAALVAIVGILIARGLAGVAILAPKGSGLWGNANTATYAIVSALVALAATGLIHLLSVATPKPTTFFGWIMVLLTLIAVVLPLSLAVSYETKIATALLNLVIGLVVTLLLISTAGSALKRANKQVAAAPPVREWDQTRPYDQGSSYYDR